ncbi:hypothetical protein ACXYUI_28505, partial [Klebsiella pneumoniae]
EPEITAKIAHLRLRVLELPISYYPRTYTQGKKISWRDGVAALRHIVYFSLLRKPSSFLSSELPKAYFPPEQHWL